MMLPQQILFTCKRVVAAVFSTPIFKTKWPMWLIQLKVPNTYHLDQRSCKNGVSKKVQEIEMSSVLSQVTTCAARKMFALSILMR